MHCPILSCFDPTYTPLTQHTHSLPNIHTPYPTYTPLTNKPTLNPAYTPLTQPTHIRTAYCSSLRLTRQNVLSQRNDIALCQPVGLIITMLDIVPPCSVLVTAVTLSVLPWKAKLPCEKWASTRTSYIVIQYPSTSFALVVTLMTLRGTRNLA